MITVDEQLIRARAALDSIQKSDNPLNDDEYKAISIALSCTGRMKMVLEKIRWSSPHAPTVELAKKALIAQV